MLLSAALLGIHSPDPWGFVQLNTLACVPGVSYRVIAQKLEREQEKRHSYFVLLSCQLSRQTRAETLATLARNTWAEKPLPPIGQQ